MTDKLRELLKDVRAVYEGKGMVLYPNSFSRLSEEIMKLDNTCRLQKEQIEKAKEIIRGLLHIKKIARLASDDDFEVILKAEAFLEE